jgi:Zn-dependent protease/predicted transcriptional regulator
LIPLATARGAEKTAVLKRRMEAQIKLFRIFGIQIGLHYSWLLIALLVALSLAGQFTATNPQWGASVIWAVSIITAILFFAAIVLHELSHAAIAKLRGLPVKSITLFALGGVAQIEKEASDPKTEFWMGIAGPIASILIGAFCLGLAALLGWNPAAAHQSPQLAMLMWLGIINISLAIFNMIPGFPLDGGRVLRAIVWWIIGDGNRATRIAARTGQAFAFLFIITGLFRFFNGAGFGGLWLTFIGWFLLDAARSSYLQVETMEHLKGIRVGDVMTRDWPVIEANLSLQQFVDDHLLQSGRRCFVVEQDGAPAGLITPHEVKDIERPQWTETRVRDVMVPLDRLHSVQPTTSVTEALERMGREDVNQLFVLSNRHLDGIISRSNILRLLQTRTELAK